MSLTLNERLTYSTLLALLPLGLVVQHVESKPEPVTSVTTWRSHIGPVFDEAEATPLPCVTGSDR